MPFSAGPNIAAKPNLVFEYDTGDVQNSYKGEPTTNQYTNPAFTNGTTGWTFGSWDSANFTYSVENVLGPFGQVIPALKITRTGTSTYAHFHQNNSGKYTTGNQYTLSAYVIGAGTFRGNSQWGDSVNFTLSSQWQRVNYTVTAPNNSNYPYWAAEAITQNVPMYFVFAQSEQKSHVTPYIDGTRSNTQGLLDVSGYNTTIDLSNMSYTSTAQPTFDDTDDYIQVASNGFNTVFNTQTYTIESVIYPTVDPDVSDSVIWSYDYTSHNNPYYAQHLRLGGSGGIINEIGFYWNNGSTYYGVEVNDAIPTLNKYYHIVATFRSGYQAVYINGSLAGSSTRADTITYYNQPIWISRANFGGYFGGLIPTIKFYNYPLSAQEVLRNYNQLKGRFNLQ